MGTQAATLNIEHTYRNSPIAPKHKAYIAVIWQNKIYVEHCAVFGLATSGGIQGHITDAAVAIFKYHGVDEVKKWVDDFVFFCIPTSHTSSESLDPVFMYHIDLSTILQISKPLGIPWHSITNKGQDFTFMFDYFGFTWSLPRPPSDFTCTVSLPDSKCLKLLAKVKAFICLSHFPVNRKSCTSLHGSLQHVTFVYRDGRAYLPRMSTFMSKFKNHFTLFHVPSSIRHDLLWWQDLLTRPSGSCTLTTWKTVDLDIWVDASTSWGIGIIVGTSWATWKLTPGWKTEGRDIGWAESIALELAIAWIVSSDVHDALVIIRGDNTGVIGKVSPFLTLDAVTCLPTILT